MHIAEYDLMHFSFLVVASILEWEIINILVTSMKCKKLVYELYCYACMYVRTHIKADV